MIKKRQNMTVKVVVQRKRTFIKKKVTASKNARWIMQKAHGVHLIKSTL